MNVKDLEFKVLDEKYREKAEQIIRNGGCIGIGCSSPSNSWGCFMHDTCLSTMIDRLSLAKEYIRQLDNAKIDALFEEYGVVIDKLNENKEV